MAYTVTKLITNAYNMSGIVSRGFETAEGEQIDDGLDSLNDILGDKSVDTGLVPYFKKFEFPGVVGQEQYVINNLSEVSTLVFFLSNVRYQMFDIGRDNYFGSPRAENIQSLPYTYHVERQLNASSIYMYFKPNENYLFQLWGKFALDQVTNLMLDLETVYDRFYIDYLKFALCKRLCINYSYPMPPDALAELKRLETNIDKMSGPLDFTINTISTLDNRGFTISYAQVNLGRGWVPGP